MMAKEGFPKYERICKENDIQVLFDEGHGFSVYPYRVIYLFRHDESRPVTCRLLVSVSKKRFHHAFKRNRVKRLMREAWRKNKAPLYEICQKDNISVDVALVYTATVIHSYEEVFTKTQKAVKEIVKRYSSNHEKHSTTAR
ncbi:MAG: ribonuclease P protein component [Bacteroidales bacterium]|jgi:ribonuclease P protein component|nr:ribonuclease P protein component [Bacteroidales bacterium]MBR6930871.1 ribonuclease P protein component [Bacteroidales bacterium]